jgi:xanthine dehydrogenase/oxidase
MKPNEIVKSINIPFNNELEFVSAYKQARRREDDIAIVTCAFRVKFSGDYKVVILQTQSDGEKVTEASLAYGGMAPLTVSAKSTEEYLIGKTWNKYFSLLIALFSPY